MSLRSYSDHGRDHSGELDVFEAANYFSASDMDDHHSLNTHQSKKDKNRTASCKEHQTWKPARALNLRPLDPTQTGHSLHSRVVTEKMIKTKQPSSPGGRLASFLNSLFNHPAARKNKKPGQDDPRPRMRRSSISHVDSKSIYRTSPPISKTFNDCKSLQDHKRVTSSSGLDQKLKIIDGLPALDKFRRNSTSGSVRKVQMVTGGDKEDEFEFSKVDSLVKYPDLDFKKLVEDHDDGHESDASSDLFELQIYHLGDFTSGLPVYETTNMDQLSPKPPSK